MNKKYTKKLTYDEQLDRCQEFITKFEDYQMEDLGQYYQAYGNKKYMIQMQQVANDEANAIEILLEDLESFFRKEDEKYMVEWFQTNTIRYIDMFSEVVSKIMPKRNTPIKPEDKTRIKFENILHQQRLQNMDNPETMNEREKIPVESHRNYDVTIIRGEVHKSHIKTISQLNSDDIGSLVTIKAIVLRASQVKPQLVIATYTCDVCGSENYAKVTDSSYKNLQKCSSKKCQENKVNGKLSFLTSHSKFISHQQLRIQETPDQILAGRIPRGFKLELKGSHVKQAAPGDVILVQGILLPIRRSGFKYQNDLSFQCCIQAFKINREKKKYVEMCINEQTITEIEQVRANTQEDMLFDMLAKSISPQIYGLESIKKALLLQMVGGVTMETHDLLRIRGQINVALIGDPGVAKSQLLKHISRLAPRGVYTTGKGSSGVGLTAAILVDANTREVSLEAGALVLADMGICCIDQFDKMEQYDRTAIHEVMEQQTVSIAKAGITASLNARTSILAAANPLYGRYNRKETPHKNINMPAALLSRFDLVFIMLDKADKVQDLQLAKHIGKIHQKCRVKDEEGIFSQTFLRNYIAKAKTYNPTIGEELHSQLIKKYVSKRLQNIDLSKAGQSYTTPRSLLALIRLCQARARLRFSHEVSESDVTDCIELMEDSQRGIIQQIQVRKPRHDTLSAIYTIIKDVCSYNESKKVSRQEIEKRVLSRGFKLQQLQITVKNYELLNVIKCQGGIITLTE